MKNKNVTFLTQAAMIAAIYVVLTYVLRRFLLERSKSGFPRPLLSCLYSPRLRYPGCL